MSRLDRASIILALFALASVAVNAATSILAMPS